jgi:hypothetical protein
MGSSLVEQSVSRAIQTEGEVCAEGWLRANFRAECGAANDPEAEAA